MEGDKRGQLPVSTLLVSTLVLLSPASDHLSLSHLLIQLYS